MTHLRTALVLVLLATHAVAEDDATGVVVETVKADTVAAMTGVQTGDILLRWRQGSSGGDLASPFDLDEIACERSPLGEVSLEGDRAGEAKTFALGSGEWGLKTRPRLDSAADRELAAALREDGVGGGQALTLLARAVTRPPVRAWLLARAAEASGVEHGAGLWAEAEAAADQSALAWVHERHGDALAAASRLEEAAAAYTRALELRREGSPAAARSLSKLGNVVFNRGEVEAAEELHRRALEIKQRVAPGSLDLAWSLNNLGVMAWARGDLEAAESLHQRALEIRERLAPESSDVAASLVNLGMVARDRRDLEAAERFYRRSLEIQERLAPGSLPLAASLINLGIVTRARGDLEGAERLYRQGLDIQERLAPGSPAEAAVLGNLGLVLLDRGDLEEAERLFRRALDITERLSPGSLAVAASLTNLAIVARARGDLEAAQPLHERALEIRERLAPGGLEVAGGLNNLGLVARDREDLDAAERFFRRGLEAEERLAPASLDVARTLSNLGLVVADRGSLEAAEQLHRRALEIRERLAPGSLDVAASLDNLGIVARDRGDLEGAERFQRRALEIRKRLAPDCTEAAVSSQELARTLRAAGRKNEAVEALRRAVRALEAQQRRLGGSPEQLAEFRARHLEIYRELLELLVELNRPEEAFGVLESARARALIALLAERDLVFGLDLPPALERERRLVNRDYERAQAHLAELSPVEQAGEVEKALAQLAEVGRRQDEIGDKIRGLSPRLAAVQYPQPLDLAGARAALDPGTVLLAYSLGEKESYLFVVTAAKGLRVVPLGVGEEALRDQVLRLRLLLEAGERGGAASRLDALRERCREAYRLLVAPAEPEIAAASRILVMPDGPLHLLPFAAVVRDTPDDNERGWQYLAEWKPLHMVVSTTVYVELRQARPRQEATVDLVAFGDPLYPPATQVGEGNDLAARSPTRGGLDLARISHRVSSRGRRGTVPSGVFDLRGAEAYSAVRRAPGGEKTPLGAVHRRPQQEAGEICGLEPLPATRDEVQAIAALYGERACAYLGAEATEERVKALGPAVRVLHLAAHGLVDERFPLSSAVVLTLRQDPVEGQDNGLLQAWEIFERVCLDCDLVVLSACRSAVGKEVAGEGLVGLTRAFQYAGARAVLASLWSVNDASTAELMKRFYVYRKAGDSNDVALRKAQLDLIRAPLVVDEGGVKVQHDLSHPVHWAAFELIGDWR